MATKKAPTPMLYDPSANANIVKNANAAAMAAVPFNAAAQNQAMANTIANLNIASTNNINKLLKAKKEKREEQNGYIADGLTKANNGLINNDMAKVRTDHLMSLKKERINGKYDKVGNEQKLENWKQKYNRTMRGFEAIQKSVLKTTAMVTNDEHIASGMTDADVDSLEALTSFFVGDGKNKEKNIQVKEIYDKKTGAASFEITTNGNKRVITEHELAKMVPVQDHGAVAKAESLLNDLITVSQGAKRGKNGKFPTYDDYKAQILNGIGNIINTSTNKEGGNNSKNAYLTLIDSKMSGQSASFLDELENTESNLFKVVLQELATIPGMVKLLDAGGQDGILDEKDFTEANNVVKLIDAIKKDVKLGSNLYASWLAEGDGRLNFEKGENLRPEEETNDGLVNYSVQEKLGREFVKAMSMKNLPPEFTGSDGNTYTKVKMTAKLAKEINKDFVKGTSGTRKDLNIFQPGMDYYKLTYGTGQVAWKTPADMVRKEKYALQFMNPISYKGSVNYFPGFRGDVNASTEGYLQTK